MTILCFTSNPLLEVSTSSREIIWEYKSCFPLKRDIFTEMYPNAANQHSKLKRPFLPFQSIKNKYGSEFFYLPVSLIENGEKYFLDGMITPEGVSIHLNISHFNNVKMTTTDFSWCSDVKRSRFTY